MIRFLYSRTSIFSICILLLIALTTLKLSGLVEVFELRERGFDYLNRIKPRNYDFNTGVVIVDIDERSLKKLGQWPWPRSLIGKLFNRLADAKVKVVGFDGFFPEYDRSSSVEFLNLNKPLLSTYTKRELSSLPRTEVSMAKAMKRLPVVMGLIGINDNNLDNTKVNNTTEFKSSIKTWYDPIPIGILNDFTSLKGSVPEINQEAIGFGIFSLLLREEKFRRAPLLSTLNHKQFIPSLVLEMLRIGKQGHSISINNTQEGIYGINIIGDNNKFSVPSNTKGDLRIYYTIPHISNQKLSRSSRYISAMNVLNGTVPSEFLKDRYVLIGSSSSGLKDLRSTPLASSLPGVEVHANLLESIITNKYLIEIPDIEVYEFAVLILVGLLIIIISSTTPFIFAFIVISGIISANILTAWYLFDKHLILYDPIYNSVSFFLIFILAFMLTYLRESKEKSFIRKAFQQYLSPSFVKQLTSSKVKLTLGGENRIMTFLFCDIRGFTTISEKFKDAPKELTNIINKFLTPLSIIITKQQGTIDKYMGDCVMAFWNAPIDVPNHAFYAVKSALAMKEAMVGISQSINENVTAALKIELLAGIGINTGNAVVGNMGSDIRFDYSVIGDPVNLASRLEGQTSNYLVDIILGEGTYNDLPDNSFKCVELDLLFVKGKKEPVRIYTVIGEYDTDIVQSKWMSFLSLHNSFLQQYRHQKWDEAIDILKQAQRLGPKEIFNYYETMIRRINSFIVNPPPENWDGVFMATKK